MAQVEEDGSQRIIGSTVMQVIIRTEGALANDRTTVGTCILLAPIR